VPLVLREYGVRPVVQPSRVDADALRRIGQRVAAAMEHPARSVRLAAARALGYYPDDDALTPLTAVLESDDLELAAEAARSLGWTFSAVRVEPLVRVLETGPTPVRVGALNALVQFVTAFGTNLSILRWKDPAELLLPFRTLRDDLEALVHALVARRERVLIVLKWARTDPSLTTAERKGLASRGVWESSYFFEALPGAAAHEQRQSRDAMRERQVRLSKEHRERHPESPRSWHERMERMEARPSYIEFRKRAEAFHREHPEVSMPYRGPAPFFHVNLAAVVRDLPEDREYTEQEMMRTAARTNADHALARRRLYEDWWMTRDGRTYRFTDRGRRAWRMERVLIGEGVS